MVFWFNGVPSNSKSWTSLKSIVWDRPAAFDRADLSLRSPPGGDRLLRLRFIWQKRFGKEDRGVRSIIAAGNGPDEQDKATF
jgi:hypothetical protein